MYGFLTDVPDMFTLSLSLTCSTLGPTVVERQLTGSWRNFTIWMAKSIRVLYTAVVEDKKRRGQQIYAVTVPMDSSMAPEPSYELINSIACRTRVRHAYEEVPCLSACGQMAG